MYLRYILELELILLDDELEDSDNGKQTQGWPLDFWLE